MDVNRIIAEKVMGWVLNSQGWWMHNGKVASKDFDPLHNISHAMMALEKFDDVVIAKFPTDKKLSLIHI